MRIPTDATHNEDLLPQHIHHTSSNLNKNVEAADKQQDP